MSACVLCDHGERQRGTTTITLNRQDAVIVFRDVPADVCDNCGEAYLAVDTARELEQLATAAITAGVKYEVREYVAAS